MAVLSLIFIATLVKQFLPKIKVIPTAVIITVVMFFALGVCGTDTLIAKYNVNAYLNGNLATVDVDALEELGDAAIPELVRLENSLNKIQNPTDEQDALKFRLNSIISKYQATSFDDSWQGITLPSLLAESSTKE